MKNIKVLFHNYGCNSYTAQTPVFVVKDETDFKGFKEFDTRCISNDNDGLVTIKVTEIRDVLVPDWFNPVLYRDSNVHIILYTVNYFKDDPAFLDDPIFEKMLQLDDFHLIIELIKIMRYNGRSGFKNSIKDRLNKWLADEIETPVTPAQKRAILTPFNKRYTWNTGY